jgi:hypothetical protein
LVERPQDSTAATTGWLPRFVALLLICSGVFFATLLGIRQVAESFGASGEPAQVIAFEAQIDEWDAVALGNSHVFRHVDPEAIDERMNGAGYPLRSFNLGAHNMSFPELYYLVRRIRALEPKRLRWVLIDLSLAWQIKPKNFATLRVVTWHDVTSGVAAVDLALNSSDPGRLGWPGVRGHLKAFGERLANLGAGVRLVEVLSNSVSSERLKVRKHRGFRALSSDSIARQAKRHRRFLDNLDDYERDVAALRASPPRSVELGAQQRRWLQRLVGDLERDGMNIVFYMAPILSNVSWRVVLESLDIEFDYVGFNDAIKYPELYAVSNRFDFGHLNAAGASVFSQLLADRLIEIRQAGERD